MPIYPKRDSGPRGLVPDLIKFGKDLDLACRRDPDGRVTITGKEAVRLLGDLGIVVVDVVGVLL